MSPPDDPAVTEMSALGVKEDMIGQASVDTNETKRLLKAW